jgi:hypothetical protein
LIVLGTGHRAQAGKSLFCNTIIEQCSRIGISCGLYSISSAIIDYLIAKNVLPAGTQRNEKDLAQNKLLVDTGNEKRRENSHFWIDAIHTMIVRDNYKVALVPNVRFPSEAELVKELGGYSVLVERVNADGSRFISESRNPNDCTETAMEFWNWDFKIINMHNRPFWLRSQAIALFDYLRNGAE